MVEVLARAISVAGEAMRGETLARRGSVAARCGIWGKAAPLLKGRNVQISALANILRQIPCTDNYFVAKTLRVLGCLSSVMAKGSLTGQVDKVMLGMSLHVQALAALISKKHVKIEIQRHVSDGLRTHVSTGCIALVYCELWLLLVKLGCVPKGCEPQADAIREALANERFSVVLCQLAAMKMQDGCLAPSCGRDFESATVDVAFPLGEFAVLKKHSLLLAKHHCMESDGVVAKIRKLRTHAGNALRELCK